MLSPALRRHNLDSRAQRLLSANNSEASSSSDDKDFSIHKVRPSQTTRNRSSMENFATERRTLLKPRFSVRSPTAGMTPQKFSPFGPRFVQPGAEDPESARKNELLQHTIKKLKKEKHGLKEVKSQIKLRETENIQNVEGLMKRVGKLKENEVVLVKELMDQQTRFNAALKESQDQIQEYERRMRDMQYQHETETAAYKRDISQLEVLSLYHHHS